MLIKPLSEDLLPTSMIKLYVRQGGQSVYPVAELICLQATSNYSWLHWQTGHPMLMPHTLKYYMAQLPPNWFIRLHRNCIVNRRYITRLQKPTVARSGMVYLHSGQSLPVSRRRWIFIKHLLLSYD